MSCSHETTLALRDALVEGLRKRLDMTFNELVIWERANNLAVALCEAFEIKQRPVETTEPPDWNDPRIR